jgi:porin
MDRLGRSVQVSTNDVARALQPQAAVGLGQQIPSGPKGAAMPDAIAQRIAASRPNQEGWQWFPATPPVLMPYLAGLDEFGNTAIQPGAVFPNDPLSPYVQDGKYWLSGLGLRYSFYQSFTMVNLTDAASGASALQYYTASFVGKWAVAESTQAGTAGWLSTEVNIQQGLSPASRTQSPQGNLGSIANPLATVYGPNGGWISELAWQQSLMHGELVVVGGLVDESNYLDANNYANNSQGQFMNSALVNSMVLPLPFNNLGLNVQWQPTDTWFVQFGTGANNQPPGGSPFTSLGLSNWSYLLELGLTPKDVFGLGPGNYRLQPFVATVGGQTQTGVGLNVGQQLGKDSPFAWFGRFGVGGNQVTLDGARCQIATGFAMQAPLKYLGLCPKLRNDYFGAGFIWSQPSAVMEPAAHANEYGFETTYVLQLTHMASIQPDLQVICNPADNPNAGCSVIFQLQLNLTW